jgi:hypothetical protein
MCRSEQNDEIARRRGCPAIRSQGSTRSFAGGASRATWRSLGARPGGMDEEARAWPCVAKIGMNFGSRLRQSPRNSPVGFRGDAFPHRRGLHVVRWEYRKVPLNEHPRSSDDIDVLCDAGANRWELVTILPNNVAYLKRPRGEPSNDADGDAAE